VFHKKGTAFFYRISKPVYYICKL